VVQGAVRDVDREAVAAMLERIKAVVSDDDFHRVEALAKTVVAITDSSEKEKRHAGALTPPVRTRAKREDRSREG
jgi:hypothetical protein